MNTGLFINGELVETKTRQSVINPSNGEKIADVSVAGTKEAQAALDAARVAFDEGPWPHLSLEQRREFLLGIAQGILDNAGELARLETLNTGKPIKESTFMDIPSCAETFKYFANNLDSFLLSETKQIASQIASAKAVLVREPQGVVVLIVPWNYPLLIACWKLAQSLAAGNTVILKPSSLTPLTALELAGIISGAGLPKGVVNIINGPGDALGKTLCEDKRVDMISFTGSNEVGKKILEYSSQNVKKSIMELGGKSAAIILKDADLEACVNGALASIFLNQGQMCTAMSRLLIEDDIYDQVIFDLIARSKRIRLGIGEDYQTQMGPLISEAQRKSVLAYIEQAKQEGAKVLSGGKIPQEGALKNGTFFEPTIIGEVTAGMAIFKEEVFGPVLCVSRFSRLDEAVELANASDFALAASIWSQDTILAQDLARRLNAGTVWINTYGMFFNELPYGGFKQSGTGKELGREGFLEYTRLKNIILDQSQGSKPLVSYWYGF